MSEDEGERADPREAMMSLVPRLRAAGRDLVGDPAEADALVAETLGVALREWGAIEPGAAVEPWLLLILGDLVAGRDRETAP